MADIWNTENPRSVVNLVPEALRLKFEEAFAREPRFFGLDEFGLAKLLRQESLRPTPTDNRIRLKFWHEYDLVQGEERNKMNISAVLAGVCSRPYFEAYYALQPSKVAWLLTPPASYSAVAEEALAFGMEQLREILEMDNRDDRGKLNVKLMELKAKIVAMLDLRVKGAPVQKTIGLQLHAPASAVAQITESNAMEQIEARMKELESRERRAQNLPAPHGDSSGDAEAGGQGVRFVESEVVPE